MTRFYHLFILVLSSLQIFSQQLDPIYLNKNYEQVNKSEFVFKRVVEKQDDANYLVKDYFKSGDLKMEGMLLSKTNKSITTDNFEKLQKKGKLIQIGLWTFKNRKGEIVQQQMFLNGKLEYRNYRDKESGLFIDGKPDIMPEYPGGGEALRQYISKELSKSGIVGSNLNNEKVYIGYIVDKMGNVQSVQLKKGENKRLANEAIRIIKHLKGYKPGIKNDHPVNVAYVIPVGF